MSKVVMNFKNHPKHRSDLPSQKAWSQHGRTEKPQFPTSDGKLPRPCRIHVPGSDGTWEAHKAHSSSKRWHYPFSGHANASHSFGISFSFQSGAWNASTTLPLCQTPANSLHLLLCASGEGAKPSVCLRRSVFPCCTFRHPHLPAHLLELSRVSMQLRRGKSKDIISPEHHKREAVKQCSRQP